MCHSSLLACVQVAQVEIDIGKSTVVQVSDNREKVMTVDINR